MKAVFALALLPLVSAIDLEDAKDLYETVFGITVDTNTEISVCVCRKHDESGGDAGTGSLDLKEPSGGYSSNSGNTDPCPTADTCASGYTKDHLYLTFNDVTCDSTTYTKTSTGFALMDQTDMEFFEITFDHSAKTTVDKEDDYTGTTAWGRFMMYDVHSLSSSKQCALDIDVVAPVLECSDATGDKDTYQTMGCCDC